jgi:hypothetical protein
MISPSKCRIITNYLTKTKHKDGKYLIELFNVKIKGDTVEVDLNVIPTKDDTSYIYKGFTCSAARVIDEISEYLSLDDKVIFEINETFFNGKPVEPVEFSFSEDFILTAENKINQLMGVFKTVKSINYERMDFRMDIEYRISKVEFPDYVTFFVTGIVNKVFFNEVEQTNLPDGIKDLIATYLAYFQEDDRNRIADYLDSLLNNDQNIDWCDVYFTVYLDYEEVLGRNPDYGYPENSDIFFSAIEDFVNGDY